MSGRRRWFWLVVLAVVVMLIGLWQDKRQTTPPPDASPAVPPASAGKPAAMVDLTRHDGQTIDFSSGRPVVQDTPADRAALERAEKEMEAAAKDVTFRAAPPETSAAAKPPTQ